MTMFVQLYLAIAALFVAAVTVLVVTPASVSHPVSVTELVELSIGLVIVLAISAVVLRRALAPLRELRTAMERTDEVSAPGRVPVRRDDEVGQVATAYNALLDRLAAEQTRSAGLVLTAQEAERRRVSRELHDQIGQTLTVALLRLGRLSQRVPDDCNDEVEGAQEAVRTALQEVRTVAAQLRPGVLEDLGLVPALTSLATEAARDGGLDVRRDIQAVPGTGAEQELVTYRIAQEALTNVLRHARASSVSVILRSEPIASARDDAPQRLVLEVIDDGVGVQAPAGAGRKGMTERAALVGGQLSIGPAGRDAAGPRGTLVRFCVPVRAPGQQPSDAADHREHPRTEENPS